MRIIRPKIWPTRTPESSKEGIIYHLIKKIAHGRLVVDDTRWSSVDEVGSHKIRLITKLQRHASLGKKGEPNFYNVMMLAFYNTILLVCMRTRHTMCNANASKE
jgi:hypothetical protein